MREWLHSPADQPGWVKITCPECSGTMIVHKKRWIRSRPEFIGRSCTYCFMTFQIPGTKAVGPKGNDKYRRADAHMRTNE